MDMKVVPWRLKEDFLYLMSCFYNEGQEGIPDLAALFRGVEIIQAWSTRGRIPHSVESTSQLVSSLISNDRSQKLALAVSISRFVSGLLDPIQQSQYAIPMAVLAKSIDLPTYFVELRHAITHEELPSLPVLRQAAQRALSWLYDHYWNPAATAESEDTYDYTETNELHKFEIKRKVKDLLKQWRSWRKVNVSANMFLPVEEHDYIQQFEALVQELVTTANLRLPYIPASFVDDEKDLDFAIETTNLDIVVSCFLEKRVLIPSRTMPISFFPKLKNVWLPLLQSIASKHSFFLPALFTTLWSEILEISQTVDSLVFLDLKEKEELTDKESAGCYLAKWYAYLMREAYTGQPWTSTLSVTQTDLASVLEICLQRSDPFTKIIIDELSILDKELENKFSPLFQYRSDMFDSRILDEQEFEDITLEQMKTELNKFSVRLNNIEAQADSSTMEFQGHVWYKPSVEPSPIGQIIES
ncbi:Pre-rRNA-processing protein las1 [Schizosaccharomyces pombe]|uniref:Pre-rRNA-processing protein las1 n=1 Tax=Schizosaccharomyces pombe (strain 972 / ATCC 24843) TaxID=284812 RepID=LAS1_SCHPO|nr:Las1-like protein [Schizosaccharomyces pombe]O42936.1 RecName: Full=Pre-rRNA-processing protein las1 [Schizosaccharomyces pombe 972h-]CAA16919.1 Las1-like protein [Schizosaccharomyces pombe]|eukprot:NP_596810.1 Las1-like protein [Schizosaccharomyces pombe]